MMCTILKFAPASKASHELKDGEQSPKRGEVVIFPGIRYEHAATADCRQHSDERAIGKRDFLVL